MLQTKLFLVPEDKDAFESFVKDHPPAGKNGMSLNQRFVLLQYENGISMADSDRIMNLQLELNTLYSNEIEEYRQYEDAVATLSKMDYYSRKSDWKEFQRNVGAMSRVVEMTQMRIEVIEKMLIHYGVRRASGQRLPSLSAIPQEEDQIAPVDTSKKVKN